MKRYNFAAAILLEQFKQMINFQSGATGSNV